MTGHGFLSLLQKSTAKKWSVICLPWPIYSAWRIGIFSYYCKRLSSGCALALHPIVPLLISPLKNFCTRNWVGLRKSVSNRALHLLRAALPLLYCCSGVSVSCPSSCTYNSHMIKNERFLAYFMRILNSCVAYHVSKCKPWVSAAYLFCSTTIRRDIHAAWCLAVVNYPDAALSVFYSTVLMRSLIFLQLWIALP